MRKTYPLQQKPQKDSPGRIQDLGAKCSSILVGLPAPTCSLLSHKILSIPINTKICKEPIYVVILISCFLIAVNATGCWGKTGWNSQLEAHGWESCGPALLVWRGIQSLWKWTAPGGINSQIEISTELRVSNEECTQPQLNPPTMQGAKKQETSSPSITPLCGKQTGLR